MLNIYLYFGRNYIILYINENYKEKILYKNYNEEYIMKIIINYFKFLNIYHVTIISNRLYYNIRNILDKDIDIKWKIESKNKIKNKLSYLRTYDILQKMDML